MFLDYSRKFCYGVMILRCKKKAEMTFKEFVEASFSVRYHLRLWERCYETGAVWGMTMSHAFLIYYSFCLCGFLASRDRFKESLRECGRLSAVI